MNQPSPIAVVGIGFRLPGGVNNLEDLEHFLNNGGSGFVPVPHDRWNRDGFHGTQQNTKGGIPSKYGYFLQQDISNFDARFFQISRQEAATIDPKQRILLQTTYEALENAGIPTEKIRGTKTSVYVSTFTYDFERMGFRDTQVLSGFHTTSVGPAILANRLSYFFDLKGPSVTLDTGCSGGLVALHQACQSLRLGESNMAIVGGAQLLLDPDQSTNMSTIGMLNADGHCYAFDSRGNGYGRGEGIATLILKRLDEALADGDPIQTVIVNSGLNQDGRSEGSIMSPSREAQRDLMRSVYSQVGLYPGETPYVEAHGTGTVAGDTNEISSIYEVFCEAKERQSDLIVGSIKANIGHLEAVAGLAGLVKCINVLNLKLIPPQLHFIKPKATLNLEERRIRVTTQLCRLPPGPCRASVNSFGYGGTNSHVIVESLSSFLQTSNWPIPEACSIQRSPSECRNKVNGTTSSQLNCTNGANGGLDQNPPWRLFVLNANTETSLRTYATKLSTWMSKHSPPEIKLADISYTLLTRRSLLPWRHTIVASNFQDLCDKLCSFRATKALPHTRLAFIFTGQGAQWIGMGKELMQFSAFKRSISSSSRILLGMGCDWNLENEIFTDIQSSRLNEAEVAQPATTALQIALVDLLSSLQIHPTCVIGHSSGEIAAAYAAGALAHKSAVEAAYRRGIYSGVAKRRNPREGSMLAVGLGEDDVQPYIQQIKGGDLCVACVNSPQSTTISGDSEALEQLKWILDTESIFSRRLRVDTAYHSHHMQVVADDYLASLGDIQTGSTESNVSFCSTVTGYSKRDGFTGDYWVRNLVSKVQFVSGLHLVSRELANSLTGGNVQFTLLEIGPTGALAGPTKQTLAEIGFKHTYLSALNRKTDACKSFLSMIGQLLELGHTLNLKSIANLKPQLKCHRPQVVSDLPGYAFDESSHWAESRVSAAHRFRKFPYNDLCGILDPASSWYEPRWRHVLNLDALPWLKDHAIDGNAVFPASGFVGMVVEAMKQLREIQQSKDEMENVMIRNMMISQAISLSLEELDAEVELQLTISPSKVGLRWHEFKIFSFDQASQRWHANCNGLITVETRVGKDEIEESREAELQAEEQIGSLQSVMSQSEQEIDRDTFYRQLAASGNEYGKSFSLLDNMYTGKNQGWCSLTIPEYAKLLPGHHMQPHLVHPTLLDSFCHIGAFLAKIPCHDASIVVGEINEMIISTDLTKVAGAKLCLATTQQPQGTRAVKSRLMVFQKSLDGHMEPVLTAYFTYRAFSVFSESHCEGHFTTKKIYSLVHQPDVDYLCSENFPITDRRDELITIQNRLTEYLNMVAFKHPRMKLLEISCTTEIVTLPFLSTIMREDSDCWPDCYDFASTSTQAVKALEPWRKRVTFRQLDVTKHLPSDQLQKRYDVVIISADILNDPLTVKMSLNNVDTLLRNGGKFIIVRTTGSDPSAEQLENMLHQRSFTGVDIRIDVSMLKQETSFILVTTKAFNSSPNSAISRYVHLVRESESLSSRAISSGLMGASYSNHQHWTWSCNTLEYTTINTNETYIVLDNAESPLLLNREPQTFARLKKLLNANVNIIWVALQETRSPIAASMRSMIQGASRVVRRENEGTTTLTIFEIDDQLTITSASDICKHLLKIIFDKNLGQSDVPQEHEYIYRNGHIMIPRLQINQKFLGGIRSRFGAADNLAEVHYHDPDRPLQLEVETPGLLNSIRFNDNPLSHNLDPWEIQVSTRAHGINFKDVFVSLGQMPPSITMVGEMSGIVTTVGREMASRYVVGDHVMGFFAKPFASSARLNGNLAHTVPDGMAFSVAATIPCVYTTAYHCLFEVARLKKGQSVFITAAAGGVGQAAIQLAQYAGASDIFVTLGSKSKKQLVMDTYGIPASHIFSSRKLDFKQGILRMTKGRGVDVVLNSLTGDMLTDAFECVAKLGTFCEIGKGDIYKGGHLRLNPFDRSITFAAVDLVAVAQDQSETVYSHLQNIVEMLEKSQLRPINPISTYPIGKIEDAFRLIAARKHTGKVVLESPEQSTVKATLPEKARFELPAHATYIIVGGLGDVGKRLAILLASRGAKHIVLLSRRVPEPELVKEIDLSVVSFDCTIHTVRCDITKEFDTFLCADYCQKNKLLVKGIIHCGMVLSDRPLAKMTSEEFAAPIGPKVYGTINLDKVFASPNLDFFIMLSSSATIIGNGSQSNYAAANAFQDAFATAKVDNANRTAYIALSLGAVEGSRAVAGISEVQSNRLKSISITMEDLLLGVEYAMTPKARQDKLSHAIMGISRQGFLDAGDVSSLKNTIFSHLAVAQNEAVASNTSNTGIAHRINNCSTVEEAQAIITEAVIAKCASFLGCDIEELSQSQPLSEIGFDSLVSIELKNWLLRTFDSLVQTAEISGASSVIALATMTTGRSRIVNAEGRPKGKVNETNTERLDDLGTRTNGLQNFKCCVAAPPPRLPLFSLEDYLDCYWQTVSVFARNDAESNSIVRAMDEFCAPNSVGARTYASLVERANDASIECWLADTHTNSVFLHFRHPIAPWNAFMHTHHDGSNPHSQAERAALLTSVAFQFLLGMERNEIGNDWLGPRPLCSYYWQWMFSAVRRPRAQCDEMTTYPESRHIAVFHKGHVFKIPLQDKPGGSSMEQFTGMFQAILDADVGEDSWIGILTTDFRDIWAANREKMIASYHTNVTYFKTIEEATFVVCLDQGTPQTNEEMVAQGIAGDGFNRWFDKTMQFVVYANGRSAHISDHTMIDGTTPLRLTEFIHDAIISHRSVSLVVQHPIAVPERFPVQTFSAMDDHMQRVRRRYRQITLTRGYRYVKTTAISQGLATGTGFSSKNCLDFTLQLAGRMHFGYNPAAWEPISLQHFHRGRPDPRQPVSKSVVTFCEAALDDSVSLVEKRRLLANAASEWDAATKRTQDGSGFLRRTEALLGLLAKLGPPPAESAEVIQYTDEQLANWKWSDSLAKIVGMDAKLPALFTNEVFNRVYPGNLYQVRNEGEFVDAAGYVMGSDCIWVSNRVRESYVALSIVGEANKVENYEKCFRRAVSIIRSIVMLNNDAVQR
ncbi:beta-ketoacyl synthase domain-containing protein [Xylaria arbuscula]|nr:beta-ketoacyl synthase domain-containing protein [Xylaria arbuscula]